MSFGPTSLALAFIAGLCSAAGIQHLANAVRTRDTQDRAYAGACLFLTATILATLGYNNAQDAAQYRFWYQWHLALSRGVFLLWPWIILRFAGLEAPWMLRVWTGFEALRALLLLAQIDRPYFFDVQGLGWVEQPWGERIAYPTGQGTALQPLQVLSPLVASFFTGLGALRCWKTGRRVDAAFLAVLATLVYGVVLLDNLADAMGWPDFQAAELAVLGPVVFLGWRASERLHEANLAIQAALQAREDERRLASLGTLAGGLAHEINNVLMAAWGQLDLARRAANAQQRDQALGLADAALRQGRETIRRVLRFARQAPEEGAAEGAVVGAAMEETAALLRPLLPPQVRLECADDSQGARVSATASELQQALMNLGLNAAQAMGEKGGRLRCTARQEGGLAVIEVEDEGPGMDETVRRRVFDPFFSAKGPNGGVGLGLSMVHGMAQRHGGSVRCASAPGRGTRFTLGLPIVGRADAPPREQAAVARLGADVVVLEDEADLREGLCKSLEALGYRAFPAAELDKALHRLAQAPGPHRVLLTDLNMPRLDGTAALEMARQRLPGVKVILSTGHLDAAEKKPGFDAVLLKPYAVEELDQRIQALLSQNP